MKESQRADHAIIEIRNTRTAFDDSSSIYTLGDRRREGAKTSHIRLIPSTVLHKYQPPEKRKRSECKNLENSPP